MCRVRSVGRRAIRASSPHCAPPTLQRYFGARLLYSQHKNVSLALALRPSVSSQTPRRITVIQFKKESFNLRPLLFSWQYSAHTHTRKPQNSPISPACEPPQIYKLLSTMLPVERDEDGTLPTARGVGALADCELHCQLPDFYCTRERPTAGAEIDAALLSNVVLQALFFDQHGIAAHHEWTKAMVDELVVCGRRRGRALISSRSLCAGAFCVHASGGWEIKRGPSRVGVNAQFKMCGCRKGEKLGMSMVV